MSTPTKKKNRILAAHVVKEPYIGPRKNGRPPFANSKEELSLYIHQYLKYIGKREYPNVAGLCFYLGISRETYYDYKSKDKFSDTIKAFEQFSENRWIQRLHQPHAVGAIFYMKNAFSDNFRERSVTDHNVHLPKPIIDVHPNNSDKKNKEEE